MQGKYLEITSPTKLVFTYEDGSGKSKPGEETTVTIMFTKVGNKTEMKFRQSNFPTIEMRDAHHGGWSGAFNCLRNFTAE